MMIYKLRSGFPAPPNVNVNQIVEEVMQLGEKERTPEAVVAKAKIKASELHKIIFRHSDKEVAYEHRLQIARTLLRAIVVIHDEGEAPEPVFVHVRKPRDAEEDTKGSYRTAATVVQQPDAFAAALEELQSKVSAAEAAVRDLERVAIRYNEGDSDRLTRIAMAVKALETAHAAVTAIH